jgi:hypothetical protein
MTEKSTVALAVERLGRLRYPSDVTFERGGGALAAAVRPASREPNESYQSRIWRFTLDGASTQLTHGSTGEQRGV